MVWFGVFIYLLIPALGGVCLWLAYQIHFKRRLTLIRDNQRNPLPHPEHIARPFAVMAAFAGLTVLAFAVAIPLYRIPFGTWHFYLGAFLGFLGIWRHVLFVRYEKHARSNPSLHLTSAGKPAGAGELKR